MAKTTEAPAAGKKPLLKGALSIRMTIYVILFAALVIAYILLTYFSKPDKIVLSHYHLSRVGYYWLVSTFVALIVLISLAGLYGSLMVKRYADLIKSSPDGKALNLIGNGFLTLSITVPLSSVISNIVGQLAKRHHSWQPALTITNNYINVVLAAVAFILIARGADELYKLSPRKRIRPLPQKFWVFLFIVASSLFSYFIDFESNAHNSVKSYYLPGWLLIVSIAIPYLYFWYRGIKAAYNIFLFQKYTMGYIYKSALKYLAAGITFVIVSSVLTQVLVSASPSLSSLSLTPILWIIYGFLAVDAVGYLLITVGAKRLRQIEEV
jgi:hypothetical protein